jgi:hypothetical protein
LDFRYFVHVYASNSGGISQENDLIQHILVSIRPDSNVNLPRPTYIHSNSQGFSSELLLFLLGAQGVGSTCPGEARVQRVKKLQILGNVTNTNFGLAKALSG